MKLQVAKESQLLANRNSSVEKERESEEDKGREGESLNGPQPQLQWPKFSDRSSDRLGGQKKENQKTCRDRDTSGQPAAGS